MKKFTSINKSGAFAKITLNQENLNLLKNEISKGYVAQVGVLGSSIHNRKNYEPRKVTEQTKSGKNKAGQVSSDLTNADIGLVHEKGSVTRHIPRRSFIEMPLTLHLQDEVKSALGSIRRAFEELDVKKAFALLGIAAENTIQKAFATRGFGKWADNAPSTVARKGSSSPLIDTAQLRKSINSRVVTK